MDQQKALYANEKSQSLFAIEWRSKNTGVLNTTVEFRTKPGVKPMLSGHAAVFDQLSEELGFFETFREIIRKGAFTESLKTADVRALWNHDPNFPLGRVAARTLRLHEDNVGLAVEIDMPDTDYARNILALVERGDVNQMSFAFGVPENGESWQRSDDGLVRELTTINLFDVSPVTFPAYTQTDVGVRNEIRSLADKIMSNQRSLIEDNATKTDNGASLKTPFDVQDIILAARETTTEEEEEQKLLAIRSAERRKFLDARTDKLVPTYREILLLSRKNS